MLPSLLCKKGNCKYSIAKLLEFHGIRCGINSMAILLVRRTSPKTGGFLALFAFQALPSPIRLEQVRPLARKSLYFTLGSVH